MKITFVTLKLSDGGAERVISVLASALAKLNNEVSILKYMDTEDEYKVADSVKQITLFDSDDAMAISRLTRIKAIRLFFRTNPCDVIIPFLDAMVGDTFAATLGMKSKIIATVRNNPDKTIGIGPRVKDVVFGLCDGVFLQTESQKEFFSKKTKDKSFVVTNPVNNRVIERGEERSYREHPSLIVACGRCSEQKNYPMLINAMEIVHKTHPELTLDIYGVGELEDSLRTLIEEKQAQSFIHMMGRTSDVSSVLLSADIYVMSSNYEGLPNSLLEAMAMGVPCISTDCQTGPRDVLGNDERGYLAKVENAEDFASKICYVADNYSEAETKAKKAREYILENATSDIVADKLLRKLEEIICTK